MPIIRLQFAGGAGLRPFDRRDDVLHGTRAHNLLGGVPRFRSGASQRKIRVADREQGPSNNESGLRLARKAGWVRPAPLLNA
jgi:hypothetical protein